jgi:DNA-binding transcriptional LysR family regulator
MPDFSLRQLRYFVAAHDAGSIAVAAEQEYVSASAVSAAVAHLESTLGVQLFVRRHAQGIFATPQGWALVAEARALLKQAEEFQRLGRALAGELAGQLRVGCLVTLAATVVPGTLRSFADAHPAIDVILAESGHQDLIAGLRSGQLDLALTYDLSREPDLVFAAIRDLPPVVLLPAGHPLAGAGSVPLARLAGEPLVLLDLPISREYFLGLFRSRRLTPRIGARSRYLDVVCSMVGNGAGYSLMNVPPAAGRAADGSPLATVPLAGSQRALRLGLLRVAAERQTRAAAAFAAHCTSALAA